MIWGMVGQDPEPNFELARVGEFGHETALRLVHRDSRLVGTSDVGQIVRVRRIVAAVAEHSRSRPNSKHAPRA